MFEKLHFTLDNAVGCPLGSVFEVTGGQMHSVDAEQEVDELLKPEVKGKYITLKVDIAVVTLNIPVGGNSYFFSFCLG